MLFRSAPRAGESPRLAPVKPPARTSAPTGSAPIETAERPQIVAFNKLDAFDPEDPIIAELQAKLEAASQSKVLLISAVSRLGLDDLMKKVWAILDFADENALDEFGIPLHLRK